MIGLISTVTGQFGKSLILATLFPVVIFLTLSLGLVEPFQSINWSQSTIIDALDPQSRVIAFTLVVLVLSGILYYFNIPLIRLYEGYPWQRSWIGQWRCQVYRSRLEDLMARRDGLTALIHAVEAVKPDDPRLEVFNNEWSRIREVIFTEWPERDLILPTRLGNVIRSFENYPVREYGMDGVVLWPRLIAKIDKDYANAIDDTKTSFDFMLNCSVLSMLLALALLVVGTLVHPEALSDPTIWVRWLVEIAALVGCSGVFYRAAIPRASAWGALFKAAFDLYRMQLLPQLGFKQKPLTRIDERELWKRITLQLLQGDLATDPRISHPQVDYAFPAFAIPAAFSTGRPYVLALSSGRAVEPEPGGKLRIRVWTRNIDRDVARDVLVEDTLPDGFELQAGSAIVDNQIASVAGSNPLFFRIGDVEVNQEKLLSYVLVPRKSP